MIDYRFVKVTNPLSLSKVEDENFCPLKDEEDCPLTPVAMYEAILHCVSERSNKPLPNPAV